MAILKIKNLRLKILIGVFDFEREKTQDIIVNIKIKFDDSEASKKDDINFTIDYKELVDKIVLEVEKSNFFLLEKLSDFIIDIIFEHQLVEKASVEIYKPNIIPNCDFVSIKKSSRKR
ncbi:MAG: hypothetical protein A2086_01070 [Spirochaetes bacterium GWD1_27_9]|nr:MAG: hypothetical protein A2Z98_16000 [Spirochaetes bacterium GWB1_27_13]OHD22667.1 MAG: hypothetical protein A2Y34_15710 [Spirochaetes bacterium GWC1_27_15]OHD33643.1 MAG: hypothetical protein A2086_01070 [Spirochaetes bacterium GWD1_27_9]